MCLVLLCSLDVALGRAKPDREVPASLCFADGSSGERGVELPPSLSPIRILREGHGVSQCECASSWGNAHMWAASLRLFFAHRETLSLPIFIQC